MLTLNNQVFGFFTFNIWLYAETWFVSLMFLLESVNWQKLELINCGKSGLDNVPFKATLCLRCSPTPSCSSSPPSGQREGPTPTMNPSTNVWKVSPKEFPSAGDFSFCCSLLRVDQHMVIVCVPLSGVCKMYEEHLKRMNPNSPSITYDISQLFDFIDDLADLSCLV